MALIVAAMMVGLTMGRSTSIMNRRWPAPSISDASRSSLGKERNAWRNRNTVKPCTRNGRKIAGIVSMSPQLAMFR